MSWRTLRAVDGRSSARIIVAEDDAAMRALVVEALRKDGYDVCAVADGASLLDRLGGPLSRPFDLIITDIRMPACDGLSVVASLRAKECAIPVILMTAFGDAAARDSARRLDAVLLDKPFELDDLRTAVLNIRAHAIKEERS
jgi:CheY-like chemotaxis protein